MDRMGGTSDEEEEEEIEMEIKEEDEEDDEDDDMDEGRGGGGTILAGIGIEQMVNIGGAGENVYYRIQQPQQLQQMQLQQPQHQGGEVGQMVVVGVRRSRPKEEKERTKLRERHRRAITARILAGLRRHGNYNLRVRADINDVIAALAREAGWVVLPDGTTFPSRSSSTSQQMMAIPPKMQERDFAGTPYVPVYVMLPLGVINMKCELMDPDGLLKQLRILKSVNVDGVMVDCWWGIVESHVPLEYNWSGYKRLFQMVRDLKLKLQVVMSFHECGGNVGDDVCIPLPHWVAEIGRTNPDIFFTDREGRRNPECLTWGIDKERVLRGRTAVEVYFDYMRSFRIEFDEFFEDGVISEIEVGLGPCGELRYPSYPVKHGWRYPGIGEFQCYDQYLLKSLRKAAEARGHSFWARGPDNAGTYNSRPHETGFFCDGGDYDSYYGRFFLGWYAQVLVDHADRVLSLAKLAFEGTCIAAKISGIHWWYKTASHAAELAAGFYNPCNRDGYASIVAMLNKHAAALNFTCVELRTLDQHEDFPEALADPEGLVWQVLNAAWDVGIPVASENALPCHDRDGYNKILENAKPMNDPDGRHLAAFTYLRLSTDLMERSNFSEFERFVKRMHGEAVLDLQL
ncbi:beta-amylase 7-like isoform X3 [Magnolia sinica]|uniref:beta-amylase 7-like isoform X3 n=1 Tax=Magnolia sinica TaxID=86752 RepID=UPI0026583D5D|nr:beta-amylase 7-like isoform X3 [Magnolia sinica]